MNETPQQYIRRILGYLGDQDPLRVQQATAKKLQRLIQPLDRKQLSRRPVTGKWSIGEILAHLADAELVGSWRLRSVLGSSGNAIQAFDQEVWAETFAYSRRVPGVSLATFRVLRENNVALLKALPKNLWARYGIHQERGKETITQIVRMFAGHDLNHLRQIEEIAKAGGKS
jgi:DinB superfamily